MRILRALVCVLAAATLSAMPARGQDLYDTTVLRTFAFQFNDANWLTLLRQNYASQTNILATLTVDGVSYPNVGVRIRGNTSYTALPSGSEKFSLNVEMDFVDPDQELMGYGSLNLNNAFHDPTFCREVLYNNYVAQFMPHPRANHVVVTLNGQNWGVYANVQQFNKRMLSTHFADTSGLRIKCANNPNGPGLRYVGTATSLYSNGYEIKDAGGFADPYAPLIAVCNAVTNNATATWQTTIDPLFAVDTSIWSVVFENILTDDDSYTNKGADFMTYRNPTDGRMHLLQTDANETFTATTWAWNRNWTQNTKPVLNRLLAVPELRQRYLAHYRRAKQDLNWAYFEPRATALRTLIDAAVQADPKKLYSYASFQQNFTTTVNLGGSPPFGGTVPGLQQFLTERNTFLNGTPEVIANGPTISSVTPSDASPDPSDPVTITAAVAPNGAAVSRVDLYYRPIPTAGYQKVQMTAAGAGQYTAPLPVAAAAGQRVQYYVCATAANAYLSQTYSPHLSEWAPLQVSYTFGSSGGMRITEWMYSGNGGEFIEFTNVSGAPINMTGWSYDDDHAVAGAFSLSAFGVVMPGESVVLAEATAAAFRTAWNLPGTVKVIGGLGSAGVGGNNLARNDEINLYNASGVLVDRLTFGDQTFPGSVRTQNFSGQACRERIGQDAVAGWVRAAIGDVYGSFASTGGDVGTPGAYASPSCNPCTAPTIGTQPSAVQVCPADGTAAFSVIATGSALEYAWQVESPAGSGTYVTLGNGPLAGVGTVSGAATAGITFSQLAWGGVAKVRAVVSNGCGSQTSDAVTLTVNGYSVCACSAADVATEGSGDPAAGPDGFLTGADFDMFLNAFFNELTRADGALIADLTDGSGSGGPDSFLTGSDFDLFIQLFFQGC